jgi:hypothetical protein
MGEIGNKNVLPNKIFQKVLHFPAISDIIKHDVLPKFAQLDVLFSTAT